MADYFDQIPPRGFARQYLGVPYVWGGCDPAVGWDCWGLYCHVIAHHYGARALPAFASVRAPVLAGPDHRAERHAAQSRAMAGFCAGVACEPIDGPQSGAAVLFKVGGRPLHVGLCLGHGQFLHVDRKMPTVIERLSCPQWAKRIEGFYVPAR